MLKRNLEHVTLFKLIVLGSYMISPQLQPGESLNYDEYAADFDNAICLRNETGMHSWAKMYITDTFFVPSDFVFYAEPTSTNHKTPLMNGMTAKAIMTGQQF